MTFHSILKKLEEERIRAIREEKIKRLKAQKSEELPTTAKFNVGGKLYEVSRPLLKGFPGTMLFKKASSPSSSSPIFIDRDPDRFAFCLDYMRDKGKVHLPETVPKLAFLEELKFFGFVDIDETKIICGEKLEQNCVDRFHQFTEASQRRIVHLEEEVETMEKEIGALEKDLEALQRNRERKKEEIKMEKEVLKSLAASFETSKDCFSVEHEDDGEEEVSHVHKDQDLSFEKPDENMIFITNLPKVPKDKLEKLTKEVNKLVARIGALETSDFPSGVCMPFDEVKGATLGFCFVRYEAPEDAKNALGVLDGYKFDKNHMISVSANSLFIGGRSNSETEGQK